MEAETTGIIISSGALSTLCTLATVWVKGKLGTKAKIEPDPLHVQKVNDCISVKECNRRMKELDERVTRLETKFDNGVEKIMDKLSAMERESEQRAVALHRRIDTISEKTSETAGAVEMIKGKMFKR